MYTNLIENTPWEQGEIKLFGKEIREPRLKAWYGSKPYTYSGVTHSPLAFTREIKGLKQSIESHTKFSFNSCLLNLYRDGTDSMGWHQDNEKELGANPIIASVSLGAERMFHLKPIQRGTSSIKLPLAHGSLLIMAGETQHYWKHQLPKTKKELGSRINLTFRWIN